MKNFYTVMLKGVKPLATFDTWEEANNFVKDKVMYGAKPLNFTYITTTRK